MIHRLLLPCILVLLTLTGDAFAFGGLFASGSSVPQPLVMTQAIQATGWSPKIIIVGEERDCIKSIHILHRPNRPFHFYGNTIRRVHYRQAARH